MRSWPDLYLPPALSEIHHPPLQLRDSYSGKFYTFNESEVTTYICGITPYDATHLGHAATYLSYDLVHRYLKASGKSVNSIQNITDVDDPLLERADRDGIAWQELAHNQIDLFRADMTALHVLPPTSYIGVVESLPLIIGDIVALTESGLTYQLGNDIYLEISKVEGALAALPMDLDEAIRIFSQRGGDPSREGKRHPLDTLLWLGERDGQPAWASPLGRGRPGWHIECLSIARHHSLSGVASCITLQGGGSDLHFPHHYMTNVQAKALTGKAFASVFTHTGMIGLDGEKMSKSKGNLLFVSKLIASGIRAQVIRLALLSRHYRDDTMWDNTRLEAAAALLSRLELSLAREEVAPTRPIIQAMVNALSNDLDTLRIVEILTDWCQATEAGVDGGSSGELARAIDLYLGITI
jgi:L-cysteine:1D-myo-inositol 2-amino-2-deoxy-alpha-D-glucopyranoside ligase